jgi:membrane protease YdiL (CAAX protease family)
MDPIYENRNPGVRLGLILLFTATGLLIFSPSFSTALPVNLRLGGLVGLILVSFAVTLAFHKIPRLRPYWRLAYIYFVACCALMLSGYAGDWALIISGQALATVKGFTLFKLAEDATIIGTIITLALITREDLDELYLTRGNFRLGLVVGITLFLVFTVLGISSTLDRGIRPDNLRELLPAYLLIALADGFMEELLFRGLFLKKLGRMVGDNCALVVTAVLFTYVHQGVLFAGSLPIFLVVVFLLGLLWGWLMQRTGSLLASALFHAGVDMLVMADAFKAFGIVS